nr:hypothetical protein [Kibdelosporangium sp. MJ126-NF4]
MTAPVAAYGAPAVTVNADQPPSESDWQWVESLSLYHPYATVRMAAWDVRTSSDKPAAYAYFSKKDGGYDFARKLGEQRKQQNLYFIQRVYDTTTTEYSPEVHSEAGRLLGSGVPDSEREAFVQYGYAAAKARDRSYRDELAAQKQALVQRDRDFVRTLAGSDPGEQVRQVAAYAVREGATDDDLVEFFAFSWSLGARMDIEATRVRHANNTMKWRATITQLIADAQLAEKTALEASEEAKEQAKSAAARAWQQVGEQTQPARSSWSQAQEFAQQQAQNWHAVLEAAQAAQGPNWSSIIDPAKTTINAWETEKTVASQQTTYWNGLLQQAIDGETRVKNSL